jgi:carbon storage regulator
MLVLTRSVGERLVIGNGEVILHVLEIRGNQVRLGVEASRHIPVNREEIYRLIVAKNQEGLKNIFQAPADPADSE